MPKMRAAVVVSKAPARLGLEKVEEPSLSPAEALVRVAAISLNRGEMRRVQNAEPGVRPGWDLAGTVVQSAADGSGPPEGTRVVGFLPSGAWAERVSVPTNALATLPERVSFEDAATLPVAGLTALYSLEKYGGLLGRKVLVTGASGGAGDFALQLAHLSGATVTALIRRAEHTALVRESGAHNVAVGEDAAAAREFAPFDLILDSVGGMALKTAIGMLAPDGMCVTFGASSGDSDVSIDVRNFFVTGGTRLYGFYLFHEIPSHPASQGLARLVSLIADGRLKPRISVRASWTEIGAISQQLVDRSYTGKAVLRVAES